MACPGDLLRIVLSIRRKAESFDHFARNRLCCNRSRIRLGFNGPDPDLETFNG